jgi:hypothetical protein
MKAGSNVTARTNIRVQRDAKKGFGIVLQAFELTHVKGPRRGF